MFDCYALCDLEWENPDSSVLDSPLPPKSGPLVDLDRNVTTSCKDDDSERGGKGFVYLAMCTKRNLSWEEMGI